MRRILIYLLVTWFVVPAGFLAYTQKTQKKKAVTVNKNALKYELNFYVTPSVTSLHSKSFGKEETGKFGFIGGFDFSYYVMKTSNALVSVGAGVIYSNYETSRSSAYQGILNTVDYNTDSVLVTEKATITETQKVSFIEFPLLVRYHYVWKSNTSAFIHFGGEFIVPLQTTYQSIGDYTRTGYYPEYNVLLGNINNPVFYYPQDLPISDQGSLHVGNGFSLLLGAGLKQRVSYHISVFFGVNLAYGMINMNKYPGNGEFLISPEYSRYNSLMGRGDKISNFAYGFQFGLSINLGKKPAGKSSSGKSTGTGAGKQLLKAK